MKHTLKRTMINKKLLGTLLLCTGAVCSTNALAQSSDIELLNQASTDNEFEVLVNKSRCLDEASRDKINASRNNQDLLDDDCAFEYFYLSAYLGSGFGGSDIDVVGEAAALGFDVFDVEEDDANLAIKLALGVSLTQNLSVELGYTRLADAEVAFSTTSSEPDLFFDLARNVRPGAVDGFTAALAYSFYTQEDWFAYGRVGAFFWEGETDSFDVFGNERLQSLPSSDGTDLFFGLGASYRLSEQFEVNVEVERYSFDDYDENTLWLGLSYHFADEY